MGKKKREQDNFLVSELNFLTKEEGSKDDFYNNFYKGRDTLYLEMIRFRNKRIEKEMPSLEEFIKLFNEDKKTALEKLFIYPINPNEIKLLEDKLLKKEITLESLYELKQLYKEKRLPRLLPLTAQ